MNTGKISTADVFAYYNDMATFRKTVIADTHIIDVFNQKANKYFVHIMMDLLFRKQVNYDAIPLLKHVQVNHNIEEYLTKLVKNGIIVDKFIDRLNYNVRQLSRHRATMKKLLTMDPDKNICIFRDLDDRISFTKQDNIINVRFSISAESDDNCISYHELNIPNDAAVTMRIDSNVFFRLKKCYRGAKRAYKIMLFDQLFNYRLLNCSGFHLAIPDTVFSAIQGCYGSTVELFASPLNHNQDVFYSLFYSDRQFGSSGNFNDFIANDIRKTTSDTKPPRKCYEVNPPYIEHIFSVSAQSILQELSSTNKFTLVYIIPDWTDCETFIMLSEHNNLVDHIVLNKKDHQYVDYSIDEFVTNICTTHIFIISNQPNRKNIRQEIINGFNR